MTQYQRIVLDAAAFDTLHTASGRRQLALFDKFLLEGAELWCAAVTLAEVCRGVARTREVEAALAREYCGQRIRVLATDESIAKRVGTVLASTHSGSERIADAHVIAVCQDADEALVLTSDPGDIKELASAIPGVRVVTRAPAS